MRNACSRNWNMVRKLTNKKMRNSHIRNLYMAINTENVKNDKCILQDLEYGNKMEKCKK